MREVDHRAMNLLGVIQSIVQLTRADSLPSFIEAVTGRIEALGRIYSLLDCTRWEGAELSPLVREELAPFGRRIHIAGPLVKLRSTAAPSIAHLPPEQAPTGANYASFYTPPRPLGVTIGSDPRRGRVRPRG